MKLESKVASQKLPICNTDYSGEHKAWQQRIEKEMMNQNQQQLQQYLQKSSMSMQSAIDNPYNYNGVTSVHDNSFNFYQASGSDPNSIKQRMFQKHYRHIYPGGSQTQAANSTQRSFSNEEGTGGGGGFVEATNTSTKQSQEILQKKRNRSVLLNKAKETNENEHGGQNSRYSQNIQNHTFGGNRNTQEHNFDKGIKKDIEIKSSFDERNSFYQERNGTSSYGKRLPSNQHIRQESPRQKSMHSNSNGGKSQKINRTNEQRYIEAKNEIPRFNEDVISLGGNSRTKSIFGGASGTGATKTKNKNLNNTQQDINDFVTEYNNTGQQQMARPQTSYSKGSISKAASIAGRSDKSKALSKGSSLRSKLVDFKKNRLIEVISKMDEQDVDQLSKQLKIDTNPKSILTNVLNQDNLERLANQSQSAYQSDMRSLTEKLNSIKAKDEVINIQSVWGEDEENVSSVVSTNHKSGSMRSVGASYYSYLTNVEKQLKEEREARKHMEEQIRQLQRKNDELGEYIKGPQRPMSNAYHNL